MGKYLVLWEVDQAKISMDSKERATGWSVLMNMVKKDRKKGLTKDWGAYVGETRGYTVIDGPELDVMTTLQRYVPFVKFNVHPVATETQVKKMIKALSK